MGYPFFLATLPALPASGEPPAWSEEQFLDEARRNLSPSDMAELDALAADAPCRSPFARSWRDFETQLRNACARIRASRLGSDPAPWIRPHAGCDGSLDRRVQDAFRSAPNPLARERALDALRLEKLSEPPSDPFGPEAVLAYFLRLRIAAKAARTNPEAGRERLRSLVESAG